MAGLTLRWRGGWWGAIAAAILICSTPVDSRAQVRGLVTGPGMTAFPIAVAPPRGDGTAGAALDAFTRTLRRDLEISGLFQVLDASAAERAAATDVGATTDYGVWQAVGAMLVAKTRYQVTGGSIVLEARLFDVAEQRELGGKRYEGGRGDLPRMANRFADEILLRLTGTRGPFDTRMAFISTRGGRSKELWVMNFDGSGLKQLTRNGTINLSPRWSPDGREILFTSYRDRHPKLYAMDFPSGRDRAVVAGRGLTIGGAFSPDGREIAISREESKGNSDIVLLDRSGAVVDRLTDDDGIDVSPSWSPDGRRIAYCSSRGGSPQIYVLDLGSRQSRRVSMQGSYNTQPSWSPAGDRIAYTGRVGGRFQIFVVEAGGGGARQITRSGGDNVDPSWSPDGRYLVFRSTRTGQGRLWVSDWRGASQTELIAGSGDDSSPSWSTWLE
jgi:TolB protein